jgi:predicted ATPase/class 3 adenylate cyclase
VGKRVRTFLFTDLESSTRAWMQDEAAMAAALGRHDTILRSVVEGHGGVLLKHTGDGVLAVFDDPLRAVEAAVAGQRALRADPDGDRLLRARMGVHTGASEERGGDHFGPTLNRAARIMAAAHGGQVLVSAAVASILGDAVPTEDLGDHRLRDLLEPERLHQVVVDDAGVYPPLRSLNAADHNLPPQRTRLIGREDDVATVCELLRSSPLVTLTGVGGVGKTRLALEVAARELEHRDGAVFVDLAPLADPAKVPAALAVGLGLPASEGGDDLEPVLRPLATRSMVVVLDNCEHLLDASADLVEAILDSCPGTVVLATSREPLGIDAEQVWRVPSLAGASAAVELFVDRATSVRVDFVLDDDSTATVVDICTQLDGIPLAIELAAARVSHLSVADIDERLGDRFRLLSGGRRRARQRHQTLQAALDWSHDLLDEPERVVLRRAAVFSGGFTLDALEHVVGESETGGRGVLDVLGSLVDRSLLVPQRGEATARRYSLLETVRLYALDRLAEAGEAGEARWRHVEWVRDWLGRPELLSIRSARSQLRADERDNVLAALDWVDGSGEMAELGRLVTDAYAVLGDGVWVDDQWRFFGRDDVEAALTGEERARYLVASGSTANALGDFPRQAELAARARESEVGGQAWRSATLLLANATSLVDADRARRLYDELLPTVPRDDPVELGWAYARSADPSIMSGDLEAGARRLDEAEQLSGMADLDYGFPHFLLGRMDRARDAANRMRSNDSEVLIMYRAPLLDGLIAAAEGRFDDAACDLVAAGRMIERYPIRLVDHDVLNAFAALAHHRGDDAHASRLLATVANSPVWARSPAMYALHVRYRRLVRARLSADEVARIRAETRGATVPDALRAELDRH